jgi:hypothetical protein
MVTDEKNSYETQAQWNVLQNGRTSKEFGFRMALACFIALSII